MLALTLALTVILGGVAFVRLRAAWRDVDAMIAAHAAPAAPATGGAHRESAGV